MAKNMPVFLTKDQLLDVLRDMVAHVEASDSMEGSIEYLMPWSQEMGDPETDPVGEGFRVRAAYRIGNQLGGQGGMRMVGEIK